MVLLPLHLKDEGFWGTLLCEVWVSLIHGPSVLPKPKKSHILMFQPSFLTIDISSADFLKLHVS